MLLKERKKLKRRYTSLLGVSAFQQFLLSLSLQAILVAALLMEWEVEVSAIRITYRTMIGCFTCSYLMQRI